MIQVLVLSWNAESLSRSLSSAVERDIRSGKSCISVRACGLKHHYHFVCITRGVSHALLLSTLVQWYPRETCLASQGICTILPSSDQPSVDKVMRNLEALSRKGRSPEAKDASGVCR